MSKAGLPTARGLARPLVWFAMPALAVASQYLAERTAGALTGRPLGLAWLGSALHTPWVRAWIGLELVSLAVWMVVLSRLKISQAFPLTALGYLLVVGMGWTAFGEPLTAAELLGGAAILAGVWMLSGPEAEP